MQGSAQPGPACRSSVSTALMTAVEPQQPGYLSHSDAAAAPVDRLPDRQTLIVSHRPQRLPSAPLSVPDQSIALRSARSLCNTAWASNVERRAACLTDC
jgi:hypothetical protein